MNACYLVETTKSPTEAVADLEASVKAHQYGVLHTYDLKATLAGKGVDLEPACHILEVCNPGKAAAVLAQDMNMNVALPCRISVYENEGRTRIGMVRPTVLLATLSQSGELKAIAEEVEADIIRIIDAVK